MQSIHTKYLSPTNSRGARIKATCDAGTLIVSYPHELSGDACHVFAAQALCEKLAAAESKRHGVADAGKAWLAPRACGELPREAGYAHVFIA